MASSHIAVSSLLSSNVGESWGHQIVVRLPGL
jgi:hypothetical protein